MRVYQGSAFITITLYRKYTQVWLPSLYPYFLQLNEEMNLANYHLLTE